MYYNLEAEMARKGLKRKDLTEAVFKNATNKTTRKLNGIVDLKLEECKLIQSKFFPEHTLDYLFEKKD